MSDGNVALSFHDLTLAKESEVVTNMIKPPIKATA
jgi:hypothetical protein